ncbi:zinc-binding dehydrogenase [Pedobacter sp. KR3-3]|uniref:alcohol dehydrogenase n=1 Tax=Pedobacter albus TaxID=3113905 RepID=A0ABU7I4S0_9SPHI|nr:zinc-binding dehydrogenase [Pedobacter sp. KR3-3]MEE1944459.1 zinc-binding dehydrogenase [Pedobacter sp. KR3-3]
MTEGNIIVFEDAGLPLQKQKHTLPELKPGEVLVKNRYTTICGSDLHTFCDLRKEQTPTVLGHEIVGRIVALHQDHPQTDYAGKSLAVGDLVTWAVFCSSPQTAWLAKGMPQKADNLFKYGHAQVTTNDAFHGGLGDYCILKAHTCLLKIPESIPLPIAATLNCAIATVAGAIRLAGNLSEKNVLITGLRLLGNVTAALCKTLGAKKIVAVDIDTKRLAQAEAFGANFRYSSNEPQLLANLLEHQIDVVFDMSGQPDAIELGIASLTIGGTAVWAGAVFKTRPIAIDAEQVIRKLITIKGLHNYNFDDLQYALNFITDNHHRFPFDTVVAKEFPLDQTQEAFQYALEHKPLRVGIRISEA